MERRREAETEVIDLGERSAEFAGTRGSEATGQIQDHSGEPELRTKADRGAAPQQEIPADVQLITGPEPSLSARGIMANTRVIVVMRMGLSRVGPASSKASRRDMPRLRSVLV